MGNKVKKIISNRKISIYINESDPNLKKDYYTILNDWFYYARRYANDVANILQCATVMNNINKSIEGDLSVKLHEYIETSSQNLNYKLLTQKYKPLLPSMFRSSIGANIYKTYSKNIGEILKGNKTVQLASEKLSKARNINFHGFIEGNDIPKGIVDVVVTDGFTGNIALKTAEGTSDLYTNYLRNSFKDNLYSDKSSLLSTF